MPESKKIFISYGHDDNAVIAGKVRDYLSSRGYDVWFDAQNIHVGNNWRQTIQNGLLECNGVIAFLTKHGVRRPNGVCLDELHIARGVAHKEVLTVLLEEEKEVDPPADLLERQYLDMSDWREKFDTESWKTYFDTKMQSLIRALENDQFSGFSGEIDILKRFLNPMENDTKAEQMLKTALVGREWLSEEVHQWLEAPKGEPMMVLYGNPGSGKSAFSANLIHYDPAVLTGILFEYNSSFLRNEDCVIRTLAFRLAAVMPDYRELLVNLCRPYLLKNESYFSENRGVDLLNRLIIDPLAHCINGGRGEKIILFDGLDETSDEVKKIIADLSRKLPVWIRVLATSRAEEPVKNRFRTARQLDIDEAARNNCLDVENYIRLRLCSGKPDQKEFETPKNAEFSLDEAQDNSSSCQNHVNQIARKTGGNFQYAVCLCDAIEKGMIDPEDIEKLSGGIEEFYFLQFERIYPDYDDFEKDRPLFEILLTDEKIPIELAMPGAGLDEYKMGKVRRRLVGTIFLVKEERAYSGSGNYMAFEFTHKSIRDWLQSYQSAGDYYVNPKQGYVKLTGITKKMLRNEIHMDKAIREYCMCNAAEFAVKCQDWEGLELLFLNSFNKEDLKNVAAKHYGFLWCDFGIKIRKIWPHIDDFPADYPMDKIKNKLYELTCLPEGCKYADKLFEFRHLYDVFDIFETCMQKARVADVLFKVLDRGLPCLANPEIDLIDEGTGTRDGMDKQILASRLVKCLRKCRENYVPVTRKYQTICDNIKIEAFYYYGQPFNSMISYNAVFSKYGNQPYQISKDICQVDENTEVEQEADKYRHLKIFYNTASLSVFLEQAEEEDEEFVSECVKNMADVEQACDLALDRIENWCFGEKVSPCQDFKREYILKIRKQYGKQGKQISATDLKSFLRQSGRSRCPKGVPISEGPLVEAIRVWHDNPEDTQVLALYGTAVGATANTFNSKENIDRMSPHILTGIRIEQCSGMSPENIYQTIRTLAFELAQVLPDYREKLLQFCEPYFNREDELIQQYHGMDFVQKMIIEPLYQCVGEGNQSNILYFMNFSNASSRMKDVLLELFRRLPKWIRVLVTSYNKLEENDLSIQQLDLEELRAYYREMAERYLMQNNMEAATEWFQKYYEYYKMRDSYEKASAYCGISEGIYRDLLKETIIGILRTKQMGGIPYVYFKRCGTKTLASLRNAMRDIMLSQSGFVFIDEIKEKIYLCTWGDQKGGCLRTYISHIFEKYMSEKEHETMEMQMTKGCFILYGERYLQILKDSLMQRVE